MGHERFRRLRLGNKEGLWSGSANGAERRLLRPGNRRERAHTDRGRGFDSEQQERPDAVLHRQQQGRLRRVPLSRLGTGSGAHGLNNMDFEFNKNKCVLVGNPPAPSSDSSCSTNNRTPARTKGDLLVMYDLSNGGTNPSIAFSRWVIAEAGVTAAAACEAGNKLPCWGKRASIAAGGGGSNRELRGVGQHRACG